MWKLLITGATGFIGQHVVKEFTQAGHDVTCLVRPSSNVEPLRRFEPRIVVSDLMDVNRLTQAVRGYDVVVHLAGLTKSFRERDFYRVNAIGTANVAQACAAQQTPPIVVYVSSLAAAGPKISQAGRTETDEMRPVSNYGKSKLAAENALLKWADQVPISILRPGIVLGEGDKDGFEIFKGAAMGFIIVPSWQDRIFSVVHAGDLAKAVAVVGGRGARLKQDLATGSYFVSGREEWTFAELGRQIGRLLGVRKVVPIYNLNMTIWAVGAVYELVSRIRRQSYIMSMDKAREATAGAWHCDSTKLLSLGFEPRPLQERLRETIAWYRNHGWLKQKNNINPPHSNAFKKQLQKS